jgi:hypothetical protein
MTEYPEYMIRASWGPRVETPEAIAARFLACMDRLKQIHPAYDNWIYNLQGKPGKFDALRETLGAAIAVGVARSDDGSKPTPIYGYWANVVNSMKFGPRTLSVTFKAGAWLNSGHFCNSAEIETGDRVVPDPTIIAYPAFKAALLALAESCDATYCSAYPMQLMDFWGKNRALRIAWMSYVSPRFAPLISPPPSALVERTARGGLLMAATDETFSTGNPAHLAVARDILAALAPFEALPWPPDATPE